MTRRYDILLDLYNYNLRGILLIYIEMFVQIRKFRVEVDYYLSDCFIQEGISEKIVLSLTLFVFKTNSIVQQKPAYVNIFSYVDDLYIYCVGENIVFIERLLQIALNKMREWLEKNAFMFSSAQYLCVHFCCKQHLYASPEIKLDKKTHSCG